MIGDDPSGRDSRDTAQQGQQTPVPSITEQGAAQGAESDTRQHESERQQRIAAIARRRRCERHWQNVKFFIECLAALATVVIMFLTGVYVQYSDKQWQVMSSQATIITTQAATVDKQRQTGEQQNANLTRQLDDFEKQNRAYLVVIGLTADLPNTKIADQKGERYILKNVGPTVASEISIESGGGAGRDHPMDAPLQQAPPPRKNGLSLGPGMEIPLNGGRMGHYDPNDE